MSSFTLGLGDTKVSEEALRRARDVAAAVMRFVRGAQGMTHDERAWFMERIEPIIAAALAEAEADRERLTWMQAHLFSIEWLPGEERWAVTRDDDGAVGKDEILRSAIDAARGRREGGDE